MIPSPFWWSNTPGFTPPAPKPKAVRKAKRMYSRLEKSAVARQIMAHICANPGITAPALVERMQTLGTYSYLLTLRADGYVRVTTKRMGVRNVPTMLLHPSKSFLEKFPPTPVAAATI